MAAKNIRLPVSTHSRPKAAGKVKKELGFNWEFQHTAARRRLAGCPDFGQPNQRFQHTAARRRLGTLPSLMTKMAIGFNTQPPEGGWVINPPLFGC